MSAFRIAVRRFAAFESAIRKQWDAFEDAAHSGLTLEVTPLDLDPLHRAIFDSNDAWDVVFMNTDWVAEAADSSALLDIGPYLSSDPPEGYPGGWSDSLMRFQQVDRRVLGLPYHDGPECLIYRRDLFEHADIPVPATWEAFHAAARRFTDPARNLWGSVFAAYPDGHNMVYDFCLQLWTRGGSLDALESGAAVEAVRFYREILRDQAAVHPGCAGFDSVKSGYAFAAGEVALMVNWFGFAAMSETILESKVRGKVGVAAIPASGGPHVSLNVYWLLAIGAGCARPATAWSFLRHCATPAMDKLLTLEGAIGCRKSTWMDADVNRAIPFYGAMEELHREARELPRTRNWASIAKAIDGMMAAAIQTDRPETELLADLAKEITL
jgi:multiple sugar transport system substrate-binding protein